MKNSTMKTIKYLLIICILMASSLSYAQQEMLYTQYMFNELAINPAYAGNHDALSLTCLARKQWIGLNGSPSTYTFTGDMPVMNKVYISPVNIIIIIIILIEIKAFLNIFSSLCQTNCF